MHEVSLIHNLMEIVKQSAVEHGIIKVSMVKLVVGESHGALPEALEFAFQVLTEGTVCAGAELEIENRPVNIKCHECASDYQPEGYVYRCPNCHSGNVELVSGRELFVDYYEGD